MLRGLKNMEIVVAAVFLAIIAYGLYAFALAEPSVKASIIAGLFAVFSLILTHQRERGKAIKEAHRDKKIEVYSKFYDLIFEFMKIAKSAGVEGFDFESPENLERMAALHRGIMFYGSPGVVVAFSDFRVPREGEAEPLSVMKRVGRILLAMREDIGLDNSGLDELSINQIIVNDDLRRLGANS